jgi:hypothetical protein
LLVTKAKAFASLSNEDSSSVTMLGIYISMIRTLEENLEKLMKSIRMIIAQDMCKNVPVLALTLELLQSFTGVGLLTAATLISGMVTFQLFQNPRNWLHSLV